MKIKRAIDFKEKFIKKHPELREDVRELFQLMKDEIVDGGSTEHEIDLFIDSCEQLVEEGV